MGTRGTGRRRSMKTERTTAEEEALNLITAQAEAKLAAKRAARAEAREIRLQELERQQREVRNEDCCDEGSGASSVSSPPAGTSCQLGAGCTCTGNGSSSLNNEVMLAEVQEKYRKAMVSIAQLDNEKNELMYVVDVLKDSLLELEELLSESRREYEDKVKEHEQEKHAHCNLMHQFREMKETLKQDQEQLNELHNKQAALVQNISDLHHTLEWKDKRIQVLEQQREFAEDSRLECTELREVQELKDASMNHGRMLKPSFCVNGATGASAVVDSANADNGVFGSPAETELKSREEDLDPQHQKQEPGEHPRSSEPLQEHVETSALPEEPYCSAESSLSVDMTVASETIPAEDGDAPQTQDQSTVNAAHIQKKETGKIIQEEQEAKSSSVQHHDSMPRPEINVEEDLQPLPTEPSCEAPQNAAELESGDKMEDKANKSQSATTSGKKKKKKRGKRKGSSHDNKNREETKSENETRANKKLKEEADIKDVNNKLKAEDAKESGTIDVSVMLRFPEKTLQESNIRSASGKTEKPTEQEGETAELLKDDKCDNEEKTEGTLHPKKAKPENAATLADGSFQIGVLEEPKTDSMFVDREDNQNPETEIVNIDEAGVRTEEEASSCPDRDETSSSDISGPILQKSSHSEGLGLIRISGAEACSVLSSKDDAAETPSSSESRPTEICSGVSGSEKPFGGVVELNPGGCEAEYGGDNIPHCATSPSHDEDSELTGRPQEQKMTEDMGRDGDWSELDPPTQSEDICASSDLLGPNGTCQNMGEEPTTADTLEVEGKFVTSDPKLEKDQNNLESESSSFHLDESRTCGGGPEEEEEQSFEFDDTELELAAVRSPSRDPEWREAMKGTSADTGAHKSCQSPSEEELGQNNLYKSEQFTDAEIQEKKNSSLSCEAAPERLENTNQTYESMEVSEAHAENPKELRGSADSEGQTKFSAAKTDIDPVRQKDFSNLCEQTGGSNEGKDAKKSSRKGKGKSKEECKMS